MVTLWRLLYFVGIHSTAISFSGDYYLHNYFTSCLFTMGNTGSTRCLQTCTCRYTHSVRSGIVFLTWDKVLNDNQTYTQNKKSIGFHNLGFRDGGKTLWFNNAELRVQYKCNLGNAYLLQIRILYVWTISLNSYTACNAYMVLVR